MALSFLVPVHSYCGELFVSLFLELESSQANRDQYFNFTTSLTQAPFRFIDAMPPKNRRQSLHITVSDTSCNFSSPSGDVPHDFDSHLGVTDEFKEAHFHVKDIMDRWATEFASRQEIRLGKNTPTLILVPNSINIRKLGSDRTIVTSVYSDPTKWRKAQLIALKKLRNKVNNLLSCKIESASRNKAVADFFPHITLMDFRHKPDLITENLRIGLQQEARTNYSPLLKFILNGYSVQYENEKHSFFFEVNPNKLDFSHPAKALMPSKSKMSNATGDTSADYIESKNFYSELDIDTVDQDTEVLNDSDLTDLNQPLSAPSLESTETKAKTQILPAGQSATQPKKGNSSSKTSTKSQAQGSS